MSKQQHTSPMNFRPPLVLKYQEAVHVAAFVRRVASWDSAGVIRIQTRGAVAALWATTPMNCMAFIAVPLGENIEPPLDTIVFAGRLRDILGDLSVVTPQNKIVAYQLPEDLPMTQQLNVLPPQGKWVLAERMSCGAVAEIVDDAIKDFHRQTEAFPSADRIFLDHLAEQIWQRPGVAAFPLKALHAARQFGFLGHANAQVEFSTLDGWKRLITPAGQVFVNTNTVRPKLRVI